MTFFLRSCLILLHAGQFIWTCIVALLYQPFVTNPLPLDSPHSKLPHSLVLVLSTTTDDPADDEIEKTLESIACAARCCMKAGIGCLSVYDRHGIARKYSLAIKEMLSGSGNQMTTYSENSSDESDSECPTPELFCDNDSKPTSVGGLLSQSSPIILGIPGRALSESKTYKRRHKERKDTSLKSKSQPSDLRLSIFSYEASKPFMSSLSRSFVVSGKLSRENDKPSVKKRVSIDSVDKLMQDHFRLPPPDLMIIHPLKQSGLICSPMELHGFPPWLLRLTEIYYDDRPSLLRAWRSRGDNRVALSEETFRRALDQFAHAEMRVGT